MNLIKKIGFALLGGVLCAFLTAPVSARAESPSATEIIKEMKIGWNLGNSLESFGDWTSGLDLETAWGNPRTTKEMIDRIAELGFSTVRIPVSWGKHTSGSDYRIDAEWMARVKTVVDYCRENDLYVILNIHHDDQTGYFCPTSDRFEETNKFVTCVWEQVAAEFADYDYHLVFEVFNEPRIVGSTYEWWFDINNPPAEILDAVECINKINRNGLDTIRAAGGNNATRLVMCPGYDASIDGARISGYQLPEDKANMVGVAIHAYTPYNFAMNVNTSEGAGTQFTASFKEELDWFFNEVNNNFVSKNIPVYIGEFGATDKANTEERVKWAEYYTKKCADMGIACMVWDNNVPEKGADKGERFGVLNRSTLEVYDTAYVNALLKYLGTKGEYFKADDGLEDKDKDSQGEDSRDVSGKDKDSEDKDTEDKDSKDKDTEDKDSKDKDAEDKDSEDKDSEDKDSGSPTSILSIAVWLIAGTVLCVLGIVLFVVVLVKGKKKKETSD